MDQWEHRKRPERLERRFEFDSYSATRDFLDRLSQLSEQRKSFPDISFGKTYVNLTIRPISEEENSELTDEEHQFANEINGLIN